MFRHQGKNRTAKHNLRIATLLSFVAGMVNVTGFLSLQKLTTNVTGHFAFFIDEVFKWELWGGSVYLVYILSFLLGSFISSILIELTYRGKKFNIYVLPAILEIGTLLLIAVLADIKWMASPNLIACLLLFAMGVQNSFVTNISKAVVRTTHLTGLFTDLGIELSHLMFPKKYLDREKIVSTIKLRLYIICFFFLGGISGGFLYSQIKFRGLIVAALLLVLGLVYDHIKFKVLLARRKFTHQKTVGKQ